MGVLFKIKPDGSEFSKLLDFFGAATGSYPHGSLLAYDNFLYGMTSQGGKSYHGTIFKIKSDGSEYCKLYDFTGNEDGTRPNGKFITDGSFLYAMINSGGKRFSKSNFIGRIYRIGLRGSEYSRVFDFSGIDGQWPHGSLISNDDFLYAMTSHGGKSNSGVIFKIKFDGTEYCKLLDFEITNGSKPFGTLIFDKTFLYGMTSAGGSNDAGVIFKIKPDGSEYSKLLDFVGHTNGSKPYGALTFDGTFLYGMTEYGGINNMGTAFRIKPDGTEYAKLFDFSGVETGKHPRGALISDGNFLYGMTRFGGTYDMGIIFKIKPDGRGYSKIIEFSGVNGCNPWGSLFFDGTFLYGMTSGGGDSFVPIRSD